MTMDTARSIIDRLPEAERQVLVAELQRLSGELRHAYRPLAANSVVKQADLANGLIAPVIRRLETLALPASAACPDCGGPLDEQGDCVDPWQATAAALARTRTNDADDGGDVA